MPDTQGVFPIYPPLSNAESIIGKLKQHDEKSQAVVREMLGDPSTNQDLTSRALEHYRKTQRPTSGSLPVDPEIVTEASDPAIKALREQIKAETSQVAQQALHSGTRQ